MKTVRFLLAALVLVLGGNSWAQNEQLTVEVAKVSRSLEKVSRALETLVQLQRTNLLMQRLEIEERRISPLASELRSSKSKLRNQEEELARITNYGDEIEQQLDEVAGSGVEEEFALKEQKRQLQREIELQTENIALTYRRIQELENDLSRARRTLEILDEQMTEALEQLAP